MGKLLFKPGVTVTPDSAGARILGSLDHIIRSYPFDLTITAGSDGHPPTDSHTLGRAFDVRAHDLTPAQRTMLLHDVIFDLAEPTSTPGPLASIPLENLASEKFFGQVEHPAAPEAHLHFQLRLGRAL
jgi:hypothetical protein